MTVPLISVVTPTWRRHDLLVSRCIPSVAAQTYGNVEHVVVSDGPDPDLASKLAGLEVTFEQLPTHDQHSRWGERARRRGDRIARGDLLAHVDDDDEVTPDFLATLAAALEEHGADFAYSQMQINWPGGNNVAVGHDPPLYGQIGISFLYRRALLEHATWGCDELTIDWFLIQRWVAAGARWAYVPRVLVHCYPSQSWGWQ